MAGNGGIDILGASSDPDAQKQSEDQFTGKTPLPYWPYDRRVARTAVETGSAPEYVRGHYESNKRGGAVGRKDPAMTLAYRLKREKRATGGGVHTGPIHSAVGGRTDHLAMNVPAGAYVIPADVVSGLGEGNTMTGQKILDRMFPDTMAKGGKAVPIMAAGGEHVISPQAIVSKYGNLNRGHAVLDKWVVEQRKKLVKTLKKLPGPARD